MKKRVFGSFLAVLGIVLCLCGSTLLFASAEGYVLHEVPVAATPSYARMNGEANELFSYIAQPIDWDSTEEVKVSFCFAIDSLDGIKNYAGPERHFAIVMNDIGTASSPDYTKLKFYQGSERYQGIQFDFTSDNDWEGNFQMAVYGGADQINSGAYALGWGNPFGPDAAKGTKASGNVENLSRILWATNSVNLTISRDSEYYNFHFTANDPNYPVDYTFSVARTCVTGTADFENDPYIGFYCLDAGTSLTTDMGYNINSVEIVEKQSEVSKEISVPFTYKTMLVGEEIGYEATVKAGDEVLADETVTYTSQNENIAEVENGKLIARGEGRTVVTATIQGGASASTTVNVIGKQGECDLRYVTNYEEMTEVISLENGIYYRADLSKGTGNADYSTGKMYIDQPLQVNKFISFDFTPVIEGKWDGSQIFYNFILNDLYDAELDGPNIDKVNINDPATAGLSGMQFRFFSDDEWASWNYNIQFARLARDGYLQQDNSYSAEFHDPKIDAVAKSIWLDQKINVRIRATDTKYILTLTAYDEVGQLTDNAWALEYDKSVVDFSHEPYFGIMVNNYRSDSQTIGYVISNFINGYVDTFKINESSDTPYELFIGENESLSVTQTYHTSVPADFDKSVTWSSSDEEIVSIGENGKLIGKKAGNAVITATDSEGNQAICLVAIDVRSLTIKSEKTINALFGDEGATIVAEVDPVGVTISFTSSDPAIVTVENGKLTYTGVGSAVITVMAGMKTETVTVNVDVAVLKLNRDSLTMQKLDVETLRVDSGGAPGAQWHSSDENVVIVENGKVTAVGEGTATITVTLGSKTATCSVVVQKKEEPSNIPDDVEETGGCSSAIGGKSVVIGGITVLCGILFCLKRKSKI